MDPEIWQGSGSTEPTGHAIYAKEGPLARWDPLGPLSSGSKTPLCCSYKTSYA